MNDDDDDDTASMADIESMAAELTPQLGETFRRRLRNMGQASLFNLATAFRAMRSPGVSGEMTIEIPSKTTDRVEIHWTPTHPGRDNLDDGGRDLRRGRW